MSSHLRFFLAWKFYHSPIDALIILLLHLHLLHLAPRGQAMARAEWRSGVSLSLLPVCCGAPGCAGRGLDTPRADGVQVVPKPAERLTSPFQCPPGTWVEAQHRSRSHSYCSLEAHWPETPRSVLAETGETQGPHSHPLRARLPAPEHVWAVVCAPLNSCGLSGAAGGGPLGRTPCGTAGTRMGAPRCAGTGGSWGRMNGGTERSSVDRGRASLLCAFSCGSSACHFSWSGLHRLCTEKAFLQCACACVGVVFPLHG